MLRPIVALLATLAAFAPAVPAASQSAGAQPPAHPHGSSASAGSARNSHWWRRRPEPWWAPTVVIDPGIVQQMLNTPTPRPPSGKNNLSKPGGEVFKSIGN